MPGTITKDMTIAQILEVHPSAAEVLLDAGMPCIGCNLAKMGTLEEGARAHDLDPDELIERLTARLSEASSDEEAQ